MYDGDTPRAERPSLRVRVQLLIPNPDMLHPSILIRPPPHIPTALAAPSTERTCPFSWPQVYDGDTPQADCPSLRGRVQLLITYLDMTRANLVPAKPACL